MIRQLNLLLMMACSLSGCLTLARFEKLADEEKNQSNYKRLVIGDHTPEDPSQPEEEMNTAASTQLAEKQQNASTTDNSTAPVDVVMDIEEFAREDNEFLLEQMINTPRGSQVGIHDKSGGRYTGTILRSNPDSIELMNCISQEAIPGPDGQQQCKTSHIPFQKIQTSAVTHFIAISPPPASFPASAEEIDGTEYSVAEIVNRSGQRQRWGKPPVPAESH